jgi:ABC-type lipoprotein release transport system permease subunit
MEQIMSALNQESTSVLPLVISSNFRTQHLGIGEQISLEIGEEALPCEVIGIIVNFPMLGDGFAITDLSLFTNLVDMELLDLTGQGVRETWLAVDPAGHQNLINNLEESGLGNSIVGSSFQKLAAYQNNLVFQEVTTAFELNAMILVPLSVVGFTLIQILSARRRTPEFTVLQAMGFSRNHLWRLVFLEGLIYIALGLSIGIGIGYGFVYLMQPLLSQILPVLNEGFVMNQITFEWRETGVRFLILVGLYMIGLILLLAPRGKNQRLAQF